ncbi:aspartate kinase [Vibrio breoganii]|uniref:Aspartokinase n=1 Tax=Vibrio breoganii TaxID=553239 RepID=A0ABX1U4S2_9VIBR|nr:aspartate kinase [Vibrio breoganii]NMO71882.1 aspartate kinase [Vibrio breoganii]NMR68420.1 aspartate kinase [Vibrio breoganii]PMG04511.1 aspartate kinase [Vibrio breoganii]PML89324.1 aspartate kinase [Vibrio breoganii]
MKNRLIVQKFGGTSVGSVERIRAVAEQVIKTKEQGNQVVVVVSAMSGETNRLQGLAYEVDSVPNSRELDVILSAGEQVTIALLAMTLNKLGHKATSLTGWQAGIVTDDMHNQATIQSVDNEKFNQLLNDDQIVIVAGFQGVNQAGSITTLGRGGSDTSAVTLAGLLGASECQIFTDVDGVYSCDPRVVESALKLEHVDFDDMQTMAKHGAKVLHEPCVEFAAKYNLDIRVLSSFSPKQGTLVTRLQSKKDVCGLALQRELARLIVNEDKAEQVAMQCQLLGIAVHSQTTKHLIVNNNDVSKLLQILSEDVSHVESISALTIVGAELEGLHLNVLPQLLAKDIKVLDSFRCDRVVKLLLLPEHLDRAANFIHAQYIEQSHSVATDKKALIL